MDPPGVEEGLFDTDQNTLWLCQNSY
jgi:hypothetical protein